MKKLAILSVFFFSASSSFAQFIVHNTGAAFQKVEDIETNASGQIMVATDNGVFVNTNNTWKQFSQGSHVQSLEPYNGGFFYGGNKKWGRCNFTSLNEDTITSPPINAITAVHVNAAGDTVFGADNGLFFVNSAGSKYYVDSASIGAKLGRIFDIEQISGNVDFHVLATTNKTLFYQTSTQSAFVLSVQSGAISDSFSSMSIDGSMVYLGYAEDGIAYSDFDDFPNNNILFINTNNTPALPSDVITALVVKNNNIYVGTDNGLAIRLNGKWKVYDKSNSNIPSNNIAEIALTGTGDVWIGTKEGQVASLSRDVVTGIQEASQQSVDVTLYPNPASDKITLEMNQSFSGKMAIYDMTGRMVISEVINNSSTQIDVHSLVSGIYLYRLTDNKGALVKTGNFTVKQ